MTIKIRPERIGLIKLRICQLIEQEIAQPHLRSSESENPHPAVPAVYNSLSNALRSMSSGFMSPLFATCLRQFLRRADDFLLTAVIDARCSGAARCFSQCAAAAGGVQRVPLLFRPGNAVLVAQDAGCARSSASSSSISRGKVLQRSARISAPIPPWRSGSSSQRRRRTGSAPQCPGSSVCRMISRRASTPWRWPMAAAMLVLLAPSGRCRP